MSFSGSLPPYLALWSVLLLFSSLLLVLVLVLVQVLVENLSGLFPGSKVMDDVFTANYR